MTKSNTNLKCIQSDLFRGCFHQRSKESLEETLGSVFTLCIVAVWNRIFPISDCDPKTCFRTSRSEVCLSHAPAALLLSLGGNYLRCSFRQKKYFTYLLINHFNMHVYLWKYYACMYIIHIYMDQRIIDALLI